MWNAGFLSSAIGRSSLRLELHPSHIHDPVGGVPRLSVLASTLVAWRPPEWNERPLPMRSIPEGGIAIPAPGRSPSGEPGS